MAYLPSVTYWFKSTVTDKWVKSSAKCFFNLTFTPYKIRYICPVDESIKSENLAIYINNIKEIFDKSIPFLFKLRLISKKKKNKINQYLFFEVNSSAVPNVFCSKLLLLLTFIRYVSEFPEILNNLNTQEISDSKSFVKNLIKTHLDISLGKFRLEKYDNLAGHGLIYPYYFEIEHAVDIKSLINNIKNQKHGNVQSFFLKK